MKERANTFVPLSLVQVRGELQCTITIPESLLAEGVAPVIAFLCHRFVELTASIEGALFSPQTHQGTSFDSDRKIQQAVEEVITAVYHFLERHLPSDHQTLREFRALFRTQTETIH